MDTLAEGTILHGRYATAAILGIGGFGITYAGLDRTLGRKVAIKELFLSGSNRDGTAVTNPPGYSTERWSKSISSFLQEARTLASIDDPSIVGVYDYFDENNTAYMVMKFIEGVTLDKYMMAHGGRLNEADALGFTRQIGRALELLHASNILHRDVKPSNVIVTPAGRAVLIDFGSAREFVSDRTVQQTAVATMGFAPPEQYHAFGRKGAYTDVYALSATCYYMLTGEAPGSEVSPIVANSPLMPALMHALAFNPNDRTPNVPAFLAELHNPTLVPPTYAAILAEQYPNSDVFRAATSLTAPTRQEAGDTDPFARAAAALTNPSNRLDNSVTSSLFDYMRQPPAAQSAQPVPNSGLPFSPVPAPLAAPLAIPPPAARRRPLLAIIGGIALVAVVAIVAFVLFSSGPASSPNQAAVAPSPTALASPTVLIALITASTTTALPASPTSPASDTPTTLPPSDTPIAPTDTLLPPTNTAPPPNTALPPTNVPLALPTSTRVPPSLPTATRVPPAAPTATRVPPAPPTATRVPPLLPTVTRVPPAPPTPTSAPPPPVNLGPLDLNAYCNRLAAFSKPAFANGSWACYNYNLQNTQTANPNQACAAQYGVGAVAAWTQANSSDTWYCAKGGQRVGGLNMNNYCQQINPLAKPDFDTDPDPGIDPLTRWACVTPAKVGGDIDSAAAASGCATQYGVPADAYVANNQWQCRRR